MSVFGVFLARIFPHLDLIRRDTEYLSVFSQNSRKCSLEKLRILSLFTQCKSALKSQSMLNLSKYAYHTNDNCLWTNFWRNLYCYYHYCYCNRLALQLFSEIILIFWSLCKSEASLEPSPYKLCHFDLHLVHAAKFFFLCFLTQNLLKLYLLEVRKNWCYF